MLKVVLILSFILFACKDNSEKKEHTPVLVEEASNKSSIEKYTETDDSNTIEDVKTEVKALFNQLMSFKNKNDFHFYGFSPTYKYNTWLLNVRKLKQTPFAKELFIKNDLVIGDLETLGLEYLNTKGKETDYSKWAKKRITAGLK